VAVTSLVEKALLYAAYDLSHAAPDRWEAFKSAFYAYAMEACVETTLMPPTPEVYVSQGRARALLRLREDFSQLAERVEKLRLAEGRQRNK
jgi:hypothetical protein